MISKIGNNNLHKEIVFGQRGVVKSGKYIPEIGDIVWLIFCSQISHEHAVRRPAVVLSPKEYNEKTEIALFCPISSKIKHYPFEVRIKTDKIDGFVLSDQIRNFDWHKRKAKYIGAVSNKILKNY